VYRAGEAFAAGQPWRVPTDQRVSPTYLPDLVNASLDLLIDGADGVWHLANDGDASWAELARKSAAALGCPEDLVEDGLTADLGLAAPRPAYSVLGTHIPARMAIIGGFGRGTGRRSAVHHSSGTPCDRVQPLGEPARLWTEANEMLLGSEPSVGWKATRAPPSRFGGNCEGSRAAELRMTSRFRQALAGLRVATPQFRRFKWERT
jgi:hypothetical protein